MGKFIKNIFQWIESTRLLAFLRRVAQDIFARISNWVIISYNDPERSKVMALIGKIRSESGLLISYNEGYQIFMAVKRTAKINGDIAEVGVYRGGSAKIICEAKGDKALHLFDTFEGLPDLSRLDNPKHFHKGEFKGAFEDVKDYLKEYSNVYLYKGLFPATAEAVKNKKFSFVNIDVDIYESTLSCLDFFYPRMNRGGIIISHDYIGAQGVRKAVDTFFQEKPEPIIELSGSQCLIVKC